jgi:hypothetical protein
MIAAKQGDEDESRQNSVKRICKDTSVYCKEDCQDFSQTLLLIAIAPMGHAVSKPSLNAIIAFDPRALSLYRG